MAPKQHTSSLRGTQGGPKSLSRTGAQLRQSELKSAPSRSFKRAPGGTQEAPRGVPQTTPRSPRRPQEAATRSQDAPKNGMLQVQFRHSDLKWVPSRGPTRNFKQIRRAFGPGRVRTSACCPLPMFFPYCFYCISHARVRGPRDPRPPN